MSFIVVGGAKVSVAHLASSALNCRSDVLGRDILIRVEYSDHCYTSSFNESVHSRADIIRGTSGRVFDAVRHQLSFNLPALLATLPSGKVHQSGAKRNYVYSAVVTLPAVTGDAGIKVTYQAFFTLRRAAAGSGHDLRLFVESAYPLSGPPLVSKRPAAIRFSILALKVLRNESVRFAAR